MSAEWNNEMRKSWADTWDQPHMRAGLELLKSRLAPKPIPISPDSIPHMEGQNTLVLAAMEHNRFLGHHQVFDLIDQIGREIKKPTQIPAPFTKEARGE